MSIHAFWWSNHSTNIRKQQKRRRKTNNPNYSFNKFTNASNTNPNMSLSSISSLSCPVYGVEMSCYVDNTNRKLCGALTWGVKLNSTLHDDKNNNDNDVLEKLRLIL